VWKEWKSLSGEQLDEKQIDEKYDAYKYYYQKQHDEDMKRAKLASLEFQAREKARK